MPEPGTQRHYKILIAQAEHGEVGAPHAAAEHGTAASGGHAAGEHSEDPLKHHSPWHFTAAGGVVALLLIVLSLLATRNLKKAGMGRLQAFMELVVEGLTNFTRTAIGPGGEKYAPLVGTIFLFVLCSNLFGMLPLPGLAVAPTANLSMTIALALVVFFTVQGVGIRTNGVGGHLKHLAGPIPALSWFMFPIEVIGEIARPVSLSIRLFGNIFGEETVIAILIGLAASTLPIFLPIPFQLPILLFGVLTSAVQALVFSLLTCVYITLARGEHAAHGEEHGDAHDEAAHSDRAAVAAH